VRGGGIAVQIQPVHSQMGEGEEVPPPHSGVEEGEEPPPSPKTGMGSLDNYRRAWLSAV